MSLSALALAIATVWTFTAETRSFGQSLALPDNTAKVRKLAFRYDVRDYGATPDDATDDDADDIQEAIAAADAAGGGTVFFGPGTYDIDTGLTVADDVTVSFEGADSTSAIRARAASSWDNDNMEAMLYIPGPTGGLGNRLGFVRNLKIDGNDLAPVGLHLYALVEWSFHNLDIESCERVGKLEDGIQNCTFVANKIQRCGSGTTKGTDTGENLAPFDDAQVVVDHGAANNHHYFEQLSATDPAQPNEAIYNLVICQSSTSAIIASYPPHSNVWHGAQIERSATSSLGAVLQSSGILNTISDGTFAVAGSRRFVTVTRQADTGPSGGDAESSTLTLRDCRFSGELAATPILIKANTTSGEAVILVNPSLINIDVFAEASDQANIRLEGSIIGAEPATWLTNILDWESTAGSNDETATSLITRTIAKSPTFPAGEPPNGTNWGTSFFVTNHQVQSVFHGGQWRNSFYNPTTRTDLTYGTTVTPSSTEGTYQKVTVTDGVGWTLEQPPSTLPGKLLALEILNSSGGAMGTVTFNGVYDLDAAWSAPANGARVVLFFVCDGTNWREVGRQPAAGGFSNPMTTEGDLILGGSSGTAGRLGIGSNGQVLKSNGTTAVWGTDSTGAGGGIVTVKEGGVNADGSGDDIQVLDFLSADFDADEDPDQEINITIAAAIARDAEVAGFFADPSTNVAFDPATWRNEMGVAIGADVVGFGGALGTPTSGTLTNCTGLPVAGIAASTSTALGVGSIELGHATDTTLARSGAGAVTIESVPIVTTTATQTLTNKTLTNPVLGASDTLTYTGRAKLASPADGQLRVSSNDGSTYAIYDHGGSITFSQAGANGTIGSATNYLDSIYMSGFINLKNEGTSGGFGVLWVEDQILHFDDSIAEGGWTIQADNLRSLGALQGDGADGNGLQLFDQDATDYGSIILDTGMYTLRDSTGANASLTTGQIAASSLNLTTDLSVPNGGTGASTLTGLLQGNGTSAFTAITPGTGVATGLATNVDSASGFVTYDADLATLKTAFSAASASGAAYIDLAEDTDNGSNRVRLSGAQSTADVTITLPATTGTVMLTADSANPTATAGAAAVNGSATTFMRSDAAPAITAASTTAAGIAELATTAEINTGTDTGRVIGVDEFAATQFATKAIQITCFDYTTDVATGDGKGYIVIPASLNGMDIVTVHAKVVTAGTTGTTDIQIANVTDAVDVLSTKLTIDSTETGSDTAATPAVINTSNDDLATNDLLRIDVDAASTTKPKGLIVTIECRKP